MKCVENKKVACRICKGDHFTAKCPYRDTLAPMDEIPGGSGTGTPGRESPDISETPAVCGVEGDLHTLHLI